MGERTVRIALVVVNLFAALSTFAGALGLVVGYMDIPVSELHRTPFADFTVPALLLGFVVGGSALAAALIALFRAAQDRALRAAEVRRARVGDRWLCHGGLDDNRDRDDRPGHLGAGALPRRRAADDRAGGSAPVG